MMGLTNDRYQHRQLSLLHAPFVLSRDHRRRDHLVHRRVMQAVTSKRLPRRRFIKKNIRLEGVEKASVEDVEGGEDLLEYAQKGCSTSS